MTILNSYAGALVGTYNADDPLVAPWWIPGWTSQDKITIQAGLGLSSFFGPGWPTNLSFVNLTGNFFDTNSSPLGGFITIMMSDNIMVQDGANFYRLPQRYTGTMVNNIAFSYNNWGNNRLYLRLGQLNVQVFATDQTTSGSTVTTDSGNTFFYWVTEHWMGGRKYQITVPSASAPGPVDINSLIVPGTVSAYKYDPTFPDIVQEDFLLGAPTPTPTASNIVTQSNTASPWNAVVDQGSLANFTFTFTAANGAPYPMNGTTWEYVVRNGSGTQVIDITTTANSEGVLVITSTSSLSEIALTLNPAATSSLAPGVYQQALWMNPGTPNAYCWLAGTLTISSVPQP